MIGLAERVDFLANSHLFNGLSREQLEQVASRLEERGFRAGEAILSPELSTRALFLIVKGKVRLQYIGRQKKERLSYLVPGDYFGEETILKTSRRKKLSAWAEEECLLLVLHEADAFQLIRTMHVLRMNFQMAARTHRLEQTQRFKWIPEDEVIYYLARKHPWLLVQALVAPMLILIPALTATFYFLVTPVGEQGQRSPLLWPALAIAVSSGVWGLWRYIDWSNDYYIVTNRRVLWLERVIGLYDSRNETPLSAVQRINVETDFWGRQLNYGTLTIRTIIGSTLILRNMPHPHQAAALIEEQWRRVQRTARQMEEEEMKQILRERILKGPAPFRPRSVIAKPPPKIDPYKGKRTPSNLFRLRSKNKRPLPIANT
ncbi:MAG: cyclic nucleotide-binding domain-containing protein [Anaerolineales bacterium]|nr:cyclic nucleotide-binding domain-containing protein [Anaerolineales bacterium]